MSLVIRETNLKKLGLPELDRILDSEFVKLVFKPKPVKKDFALFLSENEDILAYFKQMEEQVKDNHGEVKGEIQKYLQTVSDRITQFKKKLKETTAERERKEKELREEEIFQRKLAEKMAAQEKKELEAKMGINFEALGIKPPASDSAAPPPAQPDERPSPPKLRFTQKAEESEKTDVTKAIIPNEQGVVSINLGLWFDLTQEIIKRGILVIKDMDGNLQTVHDLDLDDDKVRMKIKPAIA